MEIKSRGVDVSSNNGNVNFAAIKQAGYDYAMVRVGYSVLGNNETGTGFYTYVSKSFAEQMQQAAAAGLDLGVYWYSKAFTPAQAAAEARTVLEEVKPYKLAYPVALDMEHPPVTGGTYNDRRYAGLSIPKQLDIIDGFMKVIEDAGYYGALYMSQSPMEQLRRYAPDRIDRYSCWVAQYAARCTYTGKVGMWQHHGSLRGYIGTIPGVQGAIDLNDCYVDYPGIIKAAGLNGWKLDEPEPPQEAPAGYKVYELARTFVDPQEAKRFAVERDAKTLIMYE